MSETAMLQLIALLSLVTTTVGTAFGLWIAYKQAVLKLELEKHSNASKTRYEKLEETCRETKAEVQEIKADTKEQTVILKNQEGR